MFFYTHSPKNGCLLVTQRTYCRGGAVPLPVVLHRKTTLPQAIK